jgi:hypothetical protein
MLIIIALAWTLYRVRSIGLWRWYINITITILNIIHRPVFYLKTWCFGDWILFPSSGGPIQIGPTERDSLCLNLETETNSSYWAPHCKLVPPLLFAMCVVWRFYDSVHTVWWLGWWVVCYTWNTQELNIIPIFICHNTRIVFQHAVALMYHLYTFISLLKKLYLQLHFCLIIKS